MPAYLTLLEPRYCMLWDDGYRCLRKARVQVFDRLHGSRGIYCKRHAQRMVTFLNASEPPATLPGEVGEKAMGSKKGFCAEDRARNQFREEE